MERLEQRKVLAIFLEPPIGRLIVLHRNASLSQYQTHCERLRALVHFETPKNCRNKTHFIIHMLCIIEDKKIIGNDLTG